MMKIQILISALIILLAVYNAYIILWGVYDTPKKEYYSKIWHKLGLLIRILLFFAPVIYKIEFWNWSLLFVACNVLYDFIINIIRYAEAGTPGIWHIDNKGFNKFFLTYIFNKLFSKPEKAYWISRVAFVVISFLIVLI